MTYNYHVGTVVLRNPGNTGNSKNQVFRDMFHCRYMETASMSTPGNLY